MPILYLFVYLFLASLLSACGGHKKSDPPTSAPPATDASAPSMTTLRTSYVGPGNVLMTATATDNAGVAAYCFKTTDASPSSSDACFQISNQKTINLSVPQQRYYVWAKDAAGNVSSNSSVGPCSSAGFAASDASLLKTVCMMTSVGELVVGLEATKAPRAVANFLRYVNDGFYSNTVFHRVISNFMVQGGGSTWSLAGGFAPKTPTYAPLEMELPIETGLSNLSGTIAMARTSDLNSATSQFFINVVDNTGFDSNATPYAVFGRVISGDSALTVLKSVPVVDNGAGEISAPISPPPIQWVIQLK